MFQSLRANQELFIIHKDDKPFVETGYVQNFSPPRPMGQFPKIDMVVDISASIGGQTYYFQQLPANADVADSFKNGNVIIACTKEAANRVLDKLIQQMVDSRDYYDNKHSEYANIKKSFNAESSEQPVQKESYDKIIQEMRGDITSLKEILLSALDKKQEVQPVVKETKNKKE